MAMTYKIGRIENSLELSGGGCVRMKSITLFTTTALVAATLPTGGAFAQEAGSDASVASAEASSRASDGGIEEIVVTAQKRSENAQRVPIAISAFTANALKERSIGNVSQIANIAPNTTLDAGTPYGGSSALSPDGRYDLSVGGTNLTDERYLITGSFSQGTVFGTYSRPAEWFGRLSFHL